MGIPVVVFFPLNEGESHRSDRERFSSLQEMIPVFYPNEANRVDWRGYTADVGRIKLALVDRLFEMARRWGRIPGTHLGPIAPAFALPVPSQGGLDHLTNDPSRIHALARASSPDRFRWGNPSSYKPDWSDRARLAAPLIPDGAKVLEIGVGAGNLKRLIQDRCDYVGADLEPLDTETRSLNLDSEPLPHERYDCIVALGVFEYLHRSREAAAKLASSSDHIVLSYCCTREGFPSVAEIRGRRGWVNHFSEAEFTRMFASLGLDLVSRATLQRRRRFRTGRFRVSSKSGFGLALRAFAAIDDARGTHLAKDRVLRVFPEHFHVLAREKRPQQDITMFRGCPPQGRHNSPRGSPFIGRVPDCIPKT